MTTELKLPRISYGPICLKILKEFMTYHELPKDLPLPEINESTQVALAKIFNVMIHSMGEEKRKEITRDAEAYLNDLPPSIR